MQIKTKYNIGDCVFYKHNLTIYKATVNKIKIEVHENGIIDYKYRVIHPYNGEMNAEPINTTNVHYKVYEHELFTTLEEAQRS